jgi:TRAP-type C4-dicarboxylate transport system permease large subunit
VTTTDLELQTWRSDWVAQTEPLPALKKKILRQNLQMAGAVVAIAASLLIATVMALRTRSPFMAGLAAGIGFASLTLGSYAWWVRRGAWKPAGQTTMAYLELSYKRAVARARTLRFSFYLLLIAALFYAGFLAWDRAGITVLAVVVLAAMVGELFMLRHFYRRKKSEIEETSNLLRQSAE